MGAFVNPTAYDLNPDLPALNAAYAISRIRLSVDRARVDSEYRIFFDIEHVDGINIVKDSPLGFRYLAITENIELYVELNKNTGWNWDWEFSSPVTSKNKNVAEYFGCVQDVGSDKRELKFYIEHNPNRSTVPADDIYGLNFHVEFTQVGTFRLKVAIDPQVENPPPVGGGILTSVFSSSK